MVEALVAETVAMYKPYEKLMPSMDPKHFARPPIKFLAMTVGALAKKTGFAKGLFTDEQMKGALPERDDKLAFFDDLRKFTEIVVGAPVDVNSRSIAAGKEVEKTLVLLQMMAKGAEAPKVAFDVAVQRVRGGGAPEAAVPRKADEAEAKKGRRAEPKPAEEPKVDEGEPKRSRKGAAPEPKPEEPKGDEPAAGAKRVPRKSAPVDAKVPEPEKEEAPAEAPRKARKSAPVQPKGDEGDDAPGEPAKRAAKKAEPKGGDVQADNAADGSKRAAKKAPADEGKGGEAADAPKRSRKGQEPEEREAPKKGRKKDEEEPREGGETVKRRQKENEGEAPDIDLPPARKARRSEPAPAVAEPAEAQGARKAPPRARKPKVSVPVEEPPARAPEPPAQEDDAYVEEDVNAIAAASSTDGQLVSNILAAYRKLAPEATGGSTDSLKEGIEIAKGLLQHLARQAQPLDTLLQFAQEDLGNMENDFKRWTQEIERQTKRLDEEVAAAEVSRGELRGKLEDLDRDIERQEARLRGLKASALAKEAELFRRFAAYCSDTTRS